MQRKKENKNYLPIRSYLTHNRKFQKNSKKIEKYHYGFIPSQNMLEKGRESEKIKIIVLFRSFPTGKRKFQKNRKKFKKLKKKIQKIQLLHHLKPK